jgi:hypothetical protein
MSNVVYATGKQIYNAAVAGANCGYNRSTDDHSKYSDLLNQYFKSFLSRITNEADRRKVIKKTRNDWRKAYLPLSLALVHKHKAGEPCEEHARVYMPLNASAIFDIPMAHWNAICTKSPRLLS